MGNKILYLVVGASGSGKTYIVNKICNEFNYGNTLTRTERKPRYKNEYGHIFVSSKQADLEYINSVAKTIYNGYRYYTLKEDLKDFYIIDVAGVKSIEDSNINTKIIFLKVPLFTRIKNMRKRGDNWKNILNRIIYDYTEFKGFKGNFNFKNSEEMYEYFKLLNQ